MKFIKDKIRNIITLVISFIPNVKALQPITLDMLNNHKAHRDHRILWADEVE